MARGQLPKAYLRVDPNLDAHADPEAMLLMTLWANRQPRRGRFKDLVALTRVLGPERLEAAIEREDLVPSPEGGWYLDGWDEWQEGDLEVGDRMRRLRAKRNGVTSDGSDTAATVTPASPPSEASRRLGVNGNPPDPPGPAAAQEPAATTAPGARSRDREAVLDHWRARARAYGTPGPDRQDGRKVWASLVRGRTVRELCGSVDEHLREVLIHAGRLAPDAPWPPEALPDRGPPGEVHTSATLGDGVQPQETRP